METAHGECLLKAPVLVLFHSYERLNSVMAASSTEPKDFSTAILIRVDQSGHGDFRKIQDAIDAVPSNNSDLYYIWVKPGTYRFYL